MLCLRAERLRRSLPSVLARGTLASVPAQRSIFVCVFLPQPICAAMVLSSEVFPVEESDAAVQDPMKSFTRRLKELLHTRLTECGWKDQLKAYCKEIIREKGVENVSVEELIAAVTPRARATVPDIIKRELVHEIKNFLLDQQACG
ncbi:enhancer of yellow 2 transcription factor-like [Amblyomma americanum]